MRISDWSSDVCSSDLPLVLEVDVVTVDLGLVERLRRREFGPPRQCRMDDERHRNLGDARAQAFDEGGHGAATAVAGVTRVVVLAATGALQDPVHLPAQTIERGARLAARGEGAFEIDERGLELGKRVHQTRHAIGMLEYGCLMVARL